MATAGSIVIDLLMKTGAFETDTKRAEKRLKEMEATADKWGKAIAASAATVGVAFVAWTSKMAEAGKELDRLSTLTNSTPEMFQRWSYGARQVGIEQEKLSDILKDVQDRVGDFITTGGGPMKDFFEQIAPRVGITADAFRGLSGQDALGLYVSSLEKAGLSQSEMIFYMEAMASDSSLLIPLLVDNAAGMREFGDEASRTGQVLSNETVAAAKDLDRQLTLLRGQATGLSNVLAEALVPQLAEGASRLNTFIDLTKQAWGETDTLKKKAKELSEFNGLGTWFDDLGMQLATTMDEFEGLMVVWDRMAASAKLTLASVGIGEYEDAAKAVDAAREAYERYDARANRRRWESTRMQRVTLPDNTIKTLDLTKPRSGGGKPASAKTQLDEGQRLISQMNERIALLGKETEYEKLLAQISVGSITFRTQAQQDEALAQAQVLDIYAEQQKVWEENEKRIKQLVKVTEQGTDQMSEFALEAARNIQDSFGDTFYSFITGSFDDIGTSFSQMLARMASELAASQLTRFLLGDFGSSGNIGGLLGGLIGPLMNNWSSTNTSNSWSLGSLFPNGLSEGGYTGPGAKYDVAGVVHAGEYVINAQSTMRLGRSFLDRLNGYANGGYAGPAGAPAGIGDGAVAGVQVNLVNQSSQPMDARASAPRFDGEKYVVDVVLKDLRNKGPIRRQLENI